ncbi:uncharacterized protein LOC118202571, partial [Stegodyphus dumicola]|uniref:uncharacterized protein LOC118202571 n=1 Tax=Stegodyphus dumicola TaxID=202533 RepID=UPI0015A82194
MDMEKIALKDREKMLSEMEFFSVNQLVIECAAVYDKDKLWLCHGHQNGAHITKVNCEENIMYRLNIELESRVMCMHALDDDTMLLGTLSHFVHSYSTKSRRLLWEIRLNDSVLTLASHEEDGIRQVYAGLADGTVAVIENIEGSSPKPETFYIMIGSSPVTSLRLVDKRLWCGTGNRVVILNARTLDAVDQFQTSSSCLDYISMLVSDDRGVWLTIRGSSILQLWDPNTLTCRLLFDVKDNKYPRSPKIGEDEMGGSRITALLPFSGSVLVGTAEGSLIIYDVVTKLSRSPSSAEFSSSLNRRQPAVDHIQQKIQELLMEKKRDDKGNSDVRNRLDSGCYSTPCRTPLLAQSRSGSVHASDSGIAAAPLTAQEEEQESSSPEDRSEATSHSTVKRAGETQRSSLTSPELQFSEEQTEDNAKKIDTDRDDSGQSSSSAQGKVIETTPPKKLCTCHHLNSSSVKCRHCLLEASEALRKLFDKYSLTINSTNHVDYTARYQNLLNNSRNKAAHVDKTLNKGEDVSVNNAISTPKLEGGTEDCAWSDSSVELPPSISNDGSQDDAPIRKPLLSTGSSQIEPPNVTAVKNNVLLRAISADDVTQWVKSQETLTSSLASDSYDFDDVFVAYTEDDSSNRNKASRETDGVKESIRVRALSRRRSSNLLDYSGTNSALSQRTDQWLSDIRSPWMDTASSSSGCRYPRLTDIRSQLPAWCNMMTESETTEARLNSLSYEDSVTDSPVSGTHRDILQLGDWSTHKSSETASNVSFSSTEVPYAFELNLQEKIKISDKPIKCLLETKCAGEPTIISCAGCYGDDEAVLKWTKVGDE